MKFYLEGILELRGILVTGDGLYVVQHVTADLDSESSWKLAHVLRSNKVTMETRELFFIRLSLNRISLSLLTNGQNCIDEDGNSCNTKPEPHYSEKFKGIFHTIVPASDTYYYHTDIELGCIEFEIGNKKPWFEENFVTFFAIPAILHPSGQYRASILQQENE